MTALMPMNPALQPEAQQPNTQTLIAAGGDPDPKPAEAQASADVPLVQAPQSVRDDAEREDMHRDFERRMAEANQPKVDTYVTPPVPSQIAANTRLEMEAGRRRVSEFAGIEAARQKFNAVRKAEAWEGQNTPIFRPGNFEEYKNIKGPSVSKDALTQPKV